MLNECWCLCPPGIDSWINLSRVDPDAEVQGEICLSVRTLEDVRGRCLHCHVLQARYGHDGGEGGVGGGLRMSRNPLDSSQLP